jgi:hypothetical protein
MTEGITSGQAFNARQRVLLATAYAVVTLFALVVGVVFWKWTGIL